MLKRVKIQGYKSLHQVETNLQPLTVLFGPNAAGKSNFLDALQLLSRLTTTRTLKEAFAPPYRGNPLESFAFDSQGIKGLLAKEKVSFSIEVDIELSPVVIETINRQIQAMQQSQNLDNPVSEKCLRYQIEIEILPKSGILRVADEYLAAINEKGEFKHFIEQAEQVHSTHTDSNRYLDHSLLSKPLYPPHSPHVAAIQHELASWLFFYFEPREQMRAKNPIKEVHHIGHKGEDLAAFLNTLRNLDERQFKGIEKALQMLIPSITGIDVKPNDSGEIELRLYEGPISMPARVLSEGTLRVLGLLALGGVKETATLIGFEEPENGIHPRRIRLIAELLKNRAMLPNNQLIVTTHSPILLNDIPEQFLYACRRKGGQTIIDSFSHRASLGRLEPQQDMNTICDEADNQPISERILRGDFDVA